MILCIGDSVPTTTERSHILRKILIFIICFQLFIGIAKLYYDLWSGVAEFISILILWCAQAQLNYCNCVIYVFFCMINCFSLIVYFAEGQQFNFRDRYFFFLCTISLTFYIVSIYFSFQAYKEFKGIAFDVLASNPNNEHIGFSQTPQIRRSFSRDITEYLPQKNEQT